MQSKSPRESLRGFRRPSWEQVLPLRDTWSCCHSSLLPLKLSLNDVDDDDDDDDALATELPIRDESMQYGANTKAFPARAQDADIHKSLEPGQ